MALELLKFEADWCGPCGQQGHILKSFDSVPVTEIDVDEEQEIAADYEVRSLPTLVLEQDGEIVERWTGLTQLEELEAGVERHS